MEMFFAWFLPAQITLKERPQHMVRSICNLCKVISVHGGYFQFLCYPHFYPYPFFALLKLFWLWGIVFALIAELILRSGKYQKTNRAIFAFALASVGANGNIVCMVLAGYKHIDRRYHSKHSCHQKIQHKVNCCKNSNIQ